MLLWRIFLMFIGTTLGAILGLFIVGLTQWVDGLLILLFGGAFLGAVCGWALSPFIVKPVQRSKERFPPINPPIPPPQDVLRLGWSLGIAEGVVVGAIYGGIVAAALGGYFGKILGEITATLSWEVRRHIPLLLLALFLGFLIEVAGCLIIVCIVKLLAQDPFAMCLLSASVPVAFLLRLLLPYRGFKSTQMKENLDPPGS